MGIFLVFAWEIIPWWEYFPWEIVPWCPISSGKPIVNPYELPKEKMTKIRANSHYGMSDYF
jgi:hypothetical protein